MYFFINFHPLFQKATEWRDIIFNPGPTPTTTGKYTYSKLDSGSIRLLRLLPHRDKEAPIRCEIFACPLPGGEHEAADGLYEALSYVWGSPENPRTVYLTDSDPGENDSNDTEGLSRVRNSGELSVTANLYEALTRLRHRYVDRILWVDAICIDQTNIEERNQQVMLMTQIYATARRVLVWLGEDHGDGSAAALDGILDIAKGRKTEEELTDTDSRALALFQRPWFRRVWVLQEVAAARSILVMCGPSAIDGHVFYLGVKAVYGRQLDKDGQMLLRMVGPAAQLMQETFLRNQHANRKLASGSGSRFTRQIAPLAELMLTFMNHEATDVRDKVFALLGLASDNLVGRNLDPDYGINFQTLMERLCLYLFGDSVVVNSVARANNHPLLLLRMRARVVGSFKHVPTHGGPGELRAVPSYSFPRSLWREFDKTMSFSDPRTSTQSFLASGQQVEEGDLLIVAHDHESKEPLFMFARIHSDYMALTGLSYSPDIWKHRQLWSGLYCDSYHDLWVAWDWSGKRQQADNWESLSLAGHSRERFPVGAQGRAFRSRTLGLIKWGLHFHEESDSIIQEALRAYRQVSETTDSDVEILESLLPECPEKVDIMRVARLRELACKLPAIPECDITGPSHFQATEFWARKFSCEDLYSGMGRLVSANKQEVVLVNQEIINQLVMNSTLGTLLRRIILARERTFLEPQAVVRLIHDYSASVNATAKPEMLSRALQLAEPDRIRFDNLDPAVAELEVDWPYFSKLDHVLKSLSLAKQLAEAGKIRFDDPAVAELAVYETHHDEFEHVFTSLWRKYCENPRITPGILKATLRWRSSQYDLKKLNCVLRIYEEYREAQDPPEDVFTRPVFELALQRPTSDPIGLRTMYKAFKRYGVSLRSVVNPEPFRQKTEWLELGQPKMCEVLKIDQAESLGLLSHDTLCDFLLHHDSRSNICLLLGYARPDLVATEQVLELVLRRLATYRLWKEEEDSYPLPEPADQTVQLWWLIRFLRRSGQRLPLATVTTMLGRVEAETGPKQARQPRCTCGSWEPCDSWLMFEAIAICHGLGAVRDAADEAGRRNPKACGNMFREFIGPGHLGLPSENFDLSRQEL